MVKAVKTVKINTSKKKQRQSKTSEREYSLLEILAVVSLCVVVMIFGAATYYLNFSPSTRTSNEGGPKLASPLPQTQIDWISIPTPAPSWPPKQLSIQKATYPPLAIGNESEFEIHIKRLPGLKTGIKQNLRVVLPQAVLGYNLSSSWQNRQPTGILGSPRSFLEAKQRLSEHPVFRLSRSASLEEVMEDLSKSSECRGKPVFLSMASVGDELYWQLIENFVYTMVKFDTIGCSLVICVSDEKCMRLCEDNMFPCYAFRSDVKPLPSVMEQIGELKLLHIPRALSRGVDVFMLDLDVGFLTDPMVMVRAFYDTPKIDIFVQEDLIFIMNRSKAGWKTWFTEPLPNIGLFLCRGNEKTARMFSIAWAKYSKMTDVESKKNPGKDQNHVLDAMRIGRGTFGLRFAYFSNDTAVLLDKMVYFTSRSVELGGEAALRLFAPSYTIAAHTTCYEHTTKALGLKATNAFWNPKYYDPLRKTITKQLVFIDEMQILEDVRALMWIAMKTGRAVIVPNILGPEQLEGAHVYRGQTMWPGFRVVKLKRERRKPSVTIDILEPAFYWRMQRDYDDAPPPRVHYFTKKDSLEEILSAIASFVDEPRVVLHGAASRHSLPRSSEIDRLDGEVASWANDSVGLFTLAYSKELQRYINLPSIKSVKRSDTAANQILHGMRTCEGLFSRHRGNRSCFQICD